MTNRGLSVYALALAVALLGACKKQEQPASTAQATPPPVKKETAPPSPPPASEPAAPGDGVVLKVKWPVGNYYSYRLDMEQHMTNQVPQMPKPIQQDMTTAMTYGLTVTKETDNGGRELELEFKAVEMEIKMGEQVLMSFDSKESGKNEAQNPFLGPFRKMVGSKVRMQLGADGKLEKLLNHDEWLQSIMADAGPAGSMIGQQFGEPFFRQIMDFGGALPAKPVKPGDTWPFKTELASGPMGKLALDTQVTFKGWEDRDQHKCAALAVKGNFKTSEPGQAGPMGKMSVEDGTTSGTSWFDPDLGAAIESENDQVMRMKGEMGGGQPGGGGVNFTMNMGQKVAVKLVDFKAAAK